MGLCIIKLTGKVLNMIRLSKAGKMPCKSWSLEAGKTCPGSIDFITKETLPVCAGCYAKAGNYNYPNVKAPREENRTDWKRDGWVADMVAALETERYFRWFDSGDCYHHALAEKIYTVMVLTPWVKHWLPTKSYTIAKIAVWLDRMDALENVKVRRSSPSIDGSYNPGVHGSTVVPYTDTVTSATLCGAYDRDGKCGPCRACWNKAVDVIAYPAHGKKLTSIIKKAA
jgi:hypothetical protein